MNITVTQEVKVDGDTVVTEQNVVPVEAYDEFDVTIPAAASDLEVDLQPSVSGAAKILMIKASAYPSGLNYRVHLITNPTIDLNNAHLYLGAGQIGSMGAIPDKLFFNNGTTPVQITVILARDVTPV